MRVSGRMICSTDRAKKRGLMAPCTKVNTKQGKSTVGVSIRGTMDRDTRASGSKTRYAESAHTLGSMEGSTRASG